MAVIVCHRAVVVGGETPKLTRVNAMRRRSADPATLSESSDSESPTRTCVTPERSGVKSLRTVLVVEAVIARCAAFIRRRRRRFVVARRSRVGAEGN